MLVLFAWNDSDKPLNFAAYFIMALTITELMAVDDDNYAYHLHIFLGLITTKYKLLQFNVNSRHIKAKPIYFF